MRKNDNVFLLFVAFVKDYNFSKDDFHAFVESYQKLGLDLTDDFISIKNVLHEVLTEMELYQLLNKVSTAKESVNEFQLFKVSEAAKKLSLSEPELRKAIKESRIKTINVTGGDRGTRISLEEIRKFAA